MKLKYLFILLAIALLYSCSEDEAPEPVLVLENTELSAEAQGEIML